MDKRLQPPPSIDSLLQKRKPLRDINHDICETLSPLDKAAVWITDRVGTMGFFLLIFIWTVCWLGWNLLAPKELQFDPPMGFICWLFISNLIQIMLMPLIMVGQNIQGRHSEERAKNDLDINIKAEQEIEVILRHLEYQNGILIEMMEQIKDAKNNGKT